MASAPDGAADEDRRAEGRAMPGRGHGAWSGDAVRGGVEAGAGEEAAVKGCGALDPLRNSFALLGR